MIETTSQFRGLKQFDVSNAITTSKGNQAKWILDNHFIKAPFYYDGVIWQDYLCEVLASEVCNQLGIPCVNAKLCELICYDNTILGSYTTNFLRVNEELIYYSDMHNLYRERNNNLEGEFGYGTQMLMKEFLDVYRMYANLDATKYLCDMITLDYLIGNEDRHENNFGVIYNKELDLYSFPPLFDNGISLFEHDAVYKEMSVDCARSTMRSKPFSVQFEMQFQGLKSVMYGHNNLYKNKLDTSKLVFPNELGKEYFMMRAKELNLL